MEKESLQNVQVIISQDLIYQELDGEMVLLDMKSGQYFGIDTIGVQIWNMLKENMKPLEIVETLLEEYDVAPEKCRQQVQTFLDQLQHNNLISFTV